MKNSLLLTLAIAAGLFVSCNNDDNFLNPAPGLGEPPQEFSIDKIKMRKMNVKGSKYLYTTGVETKSNGNGTGLYSVDENGKVSLVFSECFYAGEEEVTINLSIVPNFMYNFSYKVTYNSLN